MASILDLVMAGTETIATTLQWSILLMMKYPEIQSELLLPTLCPWHGCLGRGEAWSQIHRSSCALRADSHLCIVMNPDVIRCQSHHKIVPLPC